MIEPAQKEMEPPQEKKGGAQRPRLAATVREATFEDHQRVADLQARNGLSNRPRAEWCGLWTENPAYRQTRGRFPIGWVVEGAEGELGGFIGNLPFTYHLDGRELLAVSPISWVVDMPYRGYSMALVARVVNQPGIDLMMCTTLSAAAETAMRVFGVTRVPSGTWDRADFWVTDYRGFARCALRAMSAPGQNCLAHPLALSLMARDAFLRGLQRRGHSFDLELCSGFDARFDEFWECLKNENRNVLMASRTRETLTWHFRHSLARGKAWVVAAARGGRLIGYAVFDRSDHPEIGLKRVRVADLQVAAGSEDVARRLIAWALGKCREEGIHILENAGCWLNRLLIRDSFKPYNRALKSWSFYYRAYEPGLSGRLLDSRAWAPTGFDGDSSV